MRARDDPAGAAPLPRQQQQHAESSGADATLLEDDVPFGARLEAERDWLDGMLSEDDVPFGELAAADGWLPEDDVPLGELAAADTRLPACDGTPPLAAQPRYAAGRAADEAGVGEGRSKREREVERDEDEQSKRHKEAGAGQGAEECGMDWDPCVEPVSLGMVTRLLLPSDPEATSAAA